MIYYNIYYIYNILYYNYYIIFNINYYLNCFGVVSLLQVEYSSVHRLHRRRLARIDALIGAFYQGKGNQVGCDCFPPHLPCRPRPSKDIEYREPGVSLIPAELLECVVTKKHKHSVIACVKWRNSDFLNKRSLSVQKRNKVKQ